MKPRVFLSSTFTDLVDYRRAVQAGIRQLGATDVSMEFFGARDERPAEECIRLVQRESDLFVGIYAHRYGYVPDGYDASISELEYGAACSVPLPRFIYLVDDDALWAPKHVDIGAERDRLMTFKAALRKRHICQTFKSQDHLATMVVADVGRHVAMQQAERVPAGPPVEPIDMESLQVVSESELAPAGSTDVWNLRRQVVYDKSRGVFLTHVIRPSTKPGQTFDVFIYLIRHRSEDLSDVHHAEFFLGRYWGNRVFEVSPRSGFVGVATSAYGTFLCVCRVTFTDGTQVDLDRYIDFEMQRTGGAVT